MNIGKQIKDYLEANGISQTFVSDKTSIANNTLSNMLNGKRKITAEEYVAICEALNKPYDYFTEKSA